MMAQGVMIWAIVLVITSCAHIAAFSCIKQDLKINLKHYFYLKGKQIPIKIESSDRPSHLLSSHILQILLHEVLGYDGVNVVNGYNSLYNTEIFNRIGGCETKGCFNLPGSKPPETMVNLEVWSDSNINNNPWVNNDYISSAGLLGPVGRLGWYVPTATVQKHWANSRVIVDHWRSYQNKNVTSLFSTSGQNLQDILDMLYYVKDANCSECAKNAFIPGKGCTFDSGSKCALLYSSYPGLDIGKLEKQVEALKVNISIAYLGPNLDNLIKSRTKKRLPSLFFSWSPHHLVDNLNYTRVHLPDCKQSRLSPGCDYPVNKFFKVVWSPIVQNAPEAYHMIKQMKFSQRQYEQLVFLHGQRTLLNSELQDHEVVKHAACQWIKDNKRVWVKWLPDIKVKKKKIYIGAMFPLTGPYWRLPGIVPGAQMAVEHINRNNKYLSDYELVVIITDTQCKTDIAMKEFMHLIANETNPIAGILGPGCSDVAESIAGVSKHFNKIVVSYSAEALHINNRDAYPLFFRTVPPITRNGEVLGSIFSKFNWKQVVLLAEDGQFQDYHQSLHEYFHTSEVTVILQRSIPRPSNMADADKYLLEVQKSGTKIVILTSFEVSARVFMCQAYKKGMTAKQGYVWFLPHWFTIHWWHTETFNRNFNESTACTSAEMLEAIEGHFSLSSAVFGDKDSITVADITVADWQRDYRDRLKLMDGQSYYSPYASYTYDSVWTFALALHHLLTENPAALTSLDTDYTSRRLLHYMNRTNFNGVSGSVQFSSSDRTGNINIHQMHGNLSVLVGQYRPNNQDNPLELFQQYIKWYTEDNHIPSDGSSDNDCGIEGLRSLLGVNCDVAILLVNLLAVICLAVLIVVLIVSIKVRYDRKVKTTRKRMEELGLMQDSNILSLDEWEINRNKVVLNRKLGEGAFGTVYGGETMLESGWVAVAVKTLKIGSNAEQKLDFLSEAEMMKRFRHNNIVKLLGVCTRGEPAYTIMEFMLYGDLKTFLLDRRYLVGRDSKETEDVSPEMLTKYALDIASGLHYLATLRYVHRDVACRNCLVDACRTVKISDFGMTRHTMESDYYRFNRKGMLPVRWMAPESLTDGLFKHSSDIWSYGIVLYEIITFGSFPYQGLSNTQVLELVREGKTLSLPQEASPRLKNLINSCCLFDQSKRPSAENITAILTENPTLIQPCMDVPQPALPLDQQSNTYEDFQRFKLKLKKSSAISSQLKLFSSLERLPTIKRSVSRLTLVGDYPSVFYWVREYNNKSGGGVDNNNKTRLVSSDNSSELTEDPSGTATTTLLNDSHNLMTSTSDSDETCLGESLYDRFKSLV